jgi:peptide deformylase
MALREIVKDNNEFLSKKSRPVEKIDGRIKQLVDDMKETLVKADGVGLAAPQVGVLKRIFIVDINVDKSDIREFINPEIIKKKGKNDKYLEGCLSFPGRSFKIVRPEKVTVRAQNLSGDWFTFEAEDFIARALMHENDHLDGITIPQIGKEVFE